MFWSFFFLFLALAAPNRSRANLFEQTWERTIPGCFWPGLMIIHPSVNEKKMFKGFAIFSPSGPLKGPNGIIWTNLVRDHARMLQAKSEVFLTMGFRGEDVQSKMFTTDAGYYPPNSSPWTLGSGELKTSNRFKLDNGIQMCIHI